jgi:hypothetical protein
LWVAEAEGMDEAVFHVEHFKVTPSNELASSVAATKKAKPEKNGLLRRRKERDSEPRPRSMSVFGSAIGRSYVSSCREGARSRERSRLYSFISLHSACQTNHSGCQQQAT